MNEAIKFWEAERDSMWATPSIKANAQLRIDALRKAKPGSLFIVCRGDTYGSHPWRILSTTTGKEQAVPVTVESVFLGKVTTTASGFKSKGEASKALENALAKRLSQDF